MKNLVIAAVVLMASAGVARAQDAAAGEGVFNQCKACHQIGPDAEKSVGPVLNGLDGRKAGSTDYNYSEANKNSGITWSEQTFLEYIKDPRGKIPNTKMFFPGVKDEKKAKDLWAYLSQFKADGSKKDDTKK